jgi:hypothetical protein
VAALLLLDMVVALVFPYLLRKWIKKRNSKRWAREALGVHD